MSGPPFFSTPAICEAGVPPGSVPGLLRWPYLQSVSETSIVVAWGGVVDGQAGEVRYGRAPDAMRSAVATSQLVMGDGNEIRLFHVQLSDLEPGTEYCYGVSVDGEVLASGLTFRTAPVSALAPLDFFVIGDYGVNSPEQWAVRDRMLAQSDDVSLLLTTGDNAYPNGTYAEWQTNVFDVYRELLTGTAFAPALGNHDYGVAGPQPALDNLFQPTNAWHGAESERYYSFDWGPVHFVVLDTEDPLTRVNDGVTDDMADWLQADLAATRRPWKIALLHRGPYVTNPNRAPNLVVRERLVPVLEAGGVQLVLAGHNHYYERFHPLLQDAITPTAAGGIVYVTTGGGGASLYPTGASSLLATAVSDWHFVHVAVRDCELTLRALGADGREIDVVRINRCP